MFWDLHYRWGNWVRGIKQRAQSHRQTSLPGPSLLKVPCIHLTPSHMLRPLLYITTTTISPATVKQEGLNLSALTAGIFLRIPNKKYWWGKPFYPSIFLFWSIHMLAPVKAMNLLQGSSFHAVQHGFSVPKPHSLKYERAVFQHPHPCRMGQRHSFTVASRFHFQLNNSSEVLVSRNKSPKLSTSRESETRG